MDARESLLVALKREKIVGGGAAAAELTEFAESEAGSVFALRVDGKAAIALWERLRALVDETGYWPIVVGDDNDAEILSEGLEDVEESAAEWIRAGEAIDVKEWFATELEEAREDEREAREGDSGPDREVDEEDDDDDDGAEAGEAGHARGEGNDKPGVGQPVASHEAQFTVPYDILTRTPHAEVTLVLVPTRIGYHVPALLNWGGWNDCPAPEEHVALLKYWNATHGAELVSLSSDVLEMKVARPPETRELGSALAYEHFAYCRDIVEQGCGTVAALARALTGGRSWYFWWD